MLVSCLPQTRRDAFLGKNAMHITVEPGTHLSGRHTVFPGPGTLQITDTDGASLDRASFRRFRNSSGYLFCRDPGCAWIGPHVQQSANSSRSTVSQPG